MRRKMISVSTTLALMLSVAGCKDNAPEETTPAASVTTTEAVNITADDTTEAPATTLADETTAATITTTAADITPAETTTAPVTTAEETEAIEPDIPLNTEYFPDEGFCRFVSQYDQDQDGYLSPEERRSVTEILCRSDIFRAVGVTSIHSLEGIQYFPELKELNCSCLDLTELDLSHNLKLKELSCYSLRSLSELDLTQNVKLEKLKFIDLGLTELDLSHNPKLKGLEFSGLSLTELDLSHNLELNKLNVSHLNLTELDLSHNSELKEIYCSDFDLTELDLSHNLELEALGCSNFGLTELDVTQNRKLTSLYCENNKLTALDLSNNDALSSLVCYSNQLTSLDLSANQNLVSLNCVANSMSELNLSGLSKLKSVECFCNPSLKVNANNCSSSIEFCIDATASILGNSDSYKILKRYDHVPLKDGYYFADLREKDWLDLEWEQSFYEYGFDTWMNSSFTEASADQNILRILDARLLSGSGLSSDFYDCGTISLPLAQTVKYEYMDIYGETSDYTANDFNTFYSAMIEEYKSCFSKDTSGGLTLGIHILGGSIDEIYIQVDQYP